MSVSKLIESLDLVVGASAAREEAERELEEMQTEPEFPKQREDTLRTLRYYINAFAGMAARNERAGLDSRDVGALLTKHEEMRSRLEAMQP